MANPDTDFEDILFPDNVDDGPPPASEYWHDAFIIEVEAAWGKVQKFRAELSSICEAMARTCWINSTAADIVYRRSLVAEYTRGVLSSKSLRRYRRMMPSESIAPKYLNSLCTLYNASPQRVFIPTKDPVNKEFDTYYAQASVNRRLQDAHRFAAMTNVVIVRPVFVRSRLQVQILTPDLFRVVTDADGEILELWTIHAVQNRGMATQRTEFQVWTPERVFLADYEGREISASSEPNRYGRIPYAVLRLNESNENDFYGSGESDLVELCVWRNLMRLFSTRNALFQSFAILVATNMNLKKQGIKSLQPDQLLEVNQTAAFSEEGAPPGLEFVTPTPTFQMVEEYGRDVTRDFLRNRGLPGFSVDDGSGTPPSGIALEVLERELQRIVDHHALAFVSFERDFAELLAITVNRDEKRPMARLLPEFLPEFGIRHAARRVYMEPTDEYTLKTQKAAAGLAYPSTIVSEELGISGGITDEDAVKLRDKNKNLWTGGATPGTENTQTQTDPKGESQGDEKAAAPTT